VEKVELDQDHKAQSRGAILSVLHDEFVALGLIHAPPDDTSQDADERYWHEAIRRFAVAGLARSWELRALETAEL
jgi:hypothetical protein